MKKFVSLSVFLSLTGFSFSQCIPYFVNGCFSWNTKSVDVGSISWTFDNMDCSLYDYTNISTTITAGEETAMSVSSGNWCGCSVWLDYNQNDEFEDNENLYSAGNGSTEVNVFDFSLTIPETTFNGSYKMRVISSWGSDGVTPGENGYGGCGDYQYGNFVDFTVDIIGGQFPLSVDEQEFSLSILPNPASNQLTLESKNLTGSAYSILALDGTIVSTGKIAADKHQISISKLESGVYFLKLENGTQSQKFVKI